MPGIERGLRSEYEASKGQKRLMRGAVLVVSVLTIAALAIANSVKDTPEMEGLDPSLSGMGARFGDVDDSLPNRDLINNANIAQAAMASNRADNGEDFLEALYSEVYNR